MKSSAANGKLRIEPHEELEICTSWKMESVVLLQLSKAQCFFEEVLGWLSHRKINQIHHFSNYTLFRFNLLKLEPQSGSRSKIAVPLFWTLR